MPLWADYHHLPPGRPPGRQSRRDMRVRRFAFVVLVAIGVPFLAGGLVVRSLFVVAVALGLLAIGVRFRRARWTPTLRRVRLAAEPPAPRRGDAVVVSVAVTGTGTDLEVGLVCCERYDYVEVIRTHDSHSKSRSTKVADAYADWRPLAGAPGTQELTFAIPAGAPYSYEGDAISYAWRVSARGPGRRVRDLPIWVLP